MSEKAVLNAADLLAEAERRLTLDEAALIEEIKQRPKQNVPGVRFDQV